MSPIVNQSTSPADNLTRSRLRRWQQGVAGNRRQQYTCSGSLRLRSTSAAAPGFPVGEENFVDHTVTDQTSVIRFIEDNWLDGQRIGKGSFDSDHNSITQMFDFKQQRDDDGKLFLDPVNRESLSRSRAAAG